MRRIVIGIAVGLVVTMFGINPVFPDQGSDRARTVTPAQGDIPEVAVPANPIGIPPTLDDVRYRRCPIDGKRVKTDQVAIYEGKVYHFCREECVGTFWENAPAVILKMKESKEVPLVITNRDGACPSTGKPASREFFRLHGDTVTFYCCSRCRNKDVGKRTRTPVSRQKVPETTGQ